MRGSYRLLLAVVLTLAACDDDASPATLALDFGTEMDRDAAMAPTCNSDFACGDGAVCVEGECVPGECNMDRACAPGQVCMIESHTCSGSVIDRCDEHADCDAGEACVAGECREGCRADADCAAAERCNAQGRCVARPADCIDGDGDGYGAGCEAGEDCDDGSPEINPGIAENGSKRCSDGIDHDCRDGDVRCGADADGDGVTDADGDCDDSDPEVGPNQFETAYNGRDDDCDPATPDDDLDGDGFPLDCVAFCAALADEACADLCEEDCDDRAPFIHPAAHDIPANEVDEDCDGADAVPSPVDADGDGVSEVDGDCDDSNPEVAPGADEIAYNGLDDDCDEETPDNDLDGDGFAHPQDCDDADAAVNPRADEDFYNGVDDDCDPETDDADADGDGFVAVEAGGDDCDDGVAAVNPGAEEMAYNGLDDDCREETADDDLDGDGFGRDEDCDDEDGAVHPDVVEDAETRCGDGVDDDCRGGDVACDPGAVDGDGDGVPDDQDCAPDDPAVPGREEIPGNGVDDDCDPSTPDPLAPCDHDAFDAGNRNDEALTATGVADANARGIQYGDLRICDGDEDWYRIALQAGDGIEADVYFDVGTGDIAVELYQAVGDGALRLVDTGDDTRDGQTVYERRANQEATYYVRVAGTKRGVTDYAMTVNVFGDCTDDRVGPTGEHNDGRGEAVPFPEPDERRVVCDYDDDWYTFQIVGEQRVRIDVLLDHDQGDLDLELFRDGEPRRLDFSSGLRDTESMERMLDPGRYYLRVYGFRDDANAYRVLRSVGGLETVSAEIRDDVAIPDAADGEPGAITVNLPLEVPAGAIIRRLTIDDLTIEHEFLRDLVIVATWDGQDVATLWNRDGAADGTDGGMDDDFVRDFDNDIELDDRIYLEFTGMGAGDGRFGLRIEDHAVGRAGRLTELDVEVEFVQP